MANVKSNCISIFPLAKPRPGHRDSNIFYEQNIANIVNQITGVDGFVLTSKNVSSIFYTDGTNLYIKYGTIFQFSLAGRLFTLKHDLSGDGDKNTLLLSDVDNTSFSVYASIKITDGEIEGQDDDNNYYTGLQLTTNETRAKNDSRTYLKILEYKDGSFSVPKESCAKTTIDNLSYTILRIDGKPRQS